MEWLPRTVPPQDRVSVVHGDYRLDNMIFHASEPKVIAVLDWELSTLGDPLADFSYFLTHLGACRRPTAIRPARGHRGPRSAVARHPDHRRGGRAVLQADRPSRACPISTGTSPTTCSASPRSCRASPAACATAPPPAPRRKTTIKRIGPLADLRLVLRQERRRIDDANATQHDRPGSTSHRCVADPTKTGAKPPPGVRKLVV